MTFHSASEIEGAFGITFGFAGALTTSVVIIAQASFSDRASASPVQWWGADIIVRLFKRGTESLRRCRDRSSQIVLAHADRNVRAPLPGLSSGQFAWIFTTGDKEQNGHANGQTV